MLKRSNVLSCSGSDDRSVRLWDLSTGQCQFVLRTHTCADICFDDVKVLTASFDNTIGMWDWNTGEALQFFRGHTAAGKPQCHHISSPYTLVIVLFGRSCSNIKEFIPGDDFLNSPHMCT